jgi:hypothetical protein
MMMTMMMMMMMMKNKLNPLHINKPLILRQRGRGAYSK